MNRRIVLCSLVVFVALSARAQFLGDTLAAAGFAISEDQAAEGIAAIASQRGPRQATGTSDLTAPRPSTNISPATESRSVTSSPAAQPQTRANDTSVAPAPVSLSPMPEGAYSIAGGGKVYTAEETAAWKAAFQPVGTKVAAPPAESETVEVNGASFRYSKGVFYKQDGKQWAVVPAPVGARVKDRPAGGARIVYKGDPYIYYNGGFYVWNPSANAADIVAAPAGAVVTNIPETAVKQDRGGAQCYVYGQTCFRPTFRGTSVVYTVS